ncbi:unnamed protein product [Polarella glacialis]|uniref:Uncharacterized protein n=1 Tax=Polarella glacialis TaxID=89957 RepID=A0A813JEZ3_POLGL|nr:unnamed protein product [Polarella glacialis]
MAACASSLLCFSMRVPKLQRVMRCRQAAWSESKPGRAFRLPCSVLVPPSWCSLPVISRDVTEIAHLLSNSTSIGTPLISFGIMSSGRKGRRVVQFASCAPRKTARKDLGPPILAGCETRDGSLKRPGMDILQ